MLIFWHIILGLFQWKELKLHLSWCKVGSGSLVNLQWFNYLWLIATVNVTSWTILVDEASSRIISLILYWCEKCKILHLSLKQVIIHVAIAMNGVNWRGWIPKSKANYCLLTMPLAQVYNGNRQCSWSTHCMPFHSEAIYVGCTQIKILCYIDRKILSIWMHQYDMKIM